mmetsp:Transcript_13802/g.26012  ORF Transcript_13802/g.26012 Transcript_13802/m.26012 type:complete len:459 (+) Transcript_13802:185-1561(+)
MARNFFSSLLAAALICGAIANPSIEASLSSNVINDLLQQKLPKLLANVTHLDLGGFTDDFEFALIKGHIDVNDLTVRHISYDPKTTQVTFGAPNVISVVIEDVELDATCQCKIKYGLIVDNYKNLEIQTKKASAQLSVGLEATSNGSLKVDLKSFELKLGDLDIQTHTLFGLFVKLGAKLFKPFIQDAVKKTIEGEIPALNKFLASLSYTVKLPNTSTSVDLHLAAQPAVISNLYYLVQLGNSSATELPELDPLNPTFDIQAQVSQGLINEVLQVAWPLVNVTLTEFDNKTFTTDQVALFIPGLAKTFGNGKQLGFHVTINANYTPQLTFTPNTQLLIEPDVEFLVNVNQTWVHAFTLHLQTNATASFKVTDATLSAKILSLKFPSITYSDSVIGNVNVNNLKFLINEGVNIIVPLVNSKLGNVTLPLDELPFYNVTSDDVETLVGAVSFGADLELKA